MRKIDWGLFNYDVKDYAGPYHKEQAPVKGCARAFGLFHQSKPSVAVLLLHGFGGYPAELTRPGIDLFEKGLDLLAIRYPGHGTSSEDFLQTDHKMWLGACEDAYKDLVSQYKTVFLVGHSMGGTIALILAQRHKIPRIALLAPAVSVKNSPWAAWFLRPFVRKIKSGWEQDLRYKPYYENSPCDDIEMAKEYWMYIYPKQVLSLNSLVIQARRGMKNLDSNILVVFGDDDQLVWPQKSMDLIAKGNRGPTKEVLLPGGTHLLPYDRIEEVQDRAIEEVLRHLAGS